jgi:TetR/AcrR family transcriptional repressor of nem operon
LHTNRSVCFQMNDTKEYIIDQAYKLFLSHSYEAVTISDISKAVGLTKGALYHHFINKEEVFKAVIDKFLNLDILDHNVKYESCLNFINGCIYIARQIINNTFGENLTFFPINHISMLIDAMRHYPEFGSSREILLQKQLREIESVMHVAIDAGEIRDDLDIEIAALNFFSISLGLASNLYTHKSAKVAFEIYSRQVYAYYKLLKK